MSMCVHVIEGLSVCSNVRRCVGSAVDSALCVGRMGGVLDCVLCVSVCWVCGRVTG